jgi:hypothetical protein
MKMRFDKMVEFMSAQISRNGEENRRLAEEVAKLGREVKECSQDIKAIEGLLYPPTRGERGERGERGMREETSLEKTQSRISSNSAGRRMLLGSRSNERPFPSKRISGKLFKEPIKY